MTYYYFTYDMEGRAPEEYLQGRLHSAATLNDAVRKGLALAKRSYGCSVIISKADSKEDAYKRKSQVGMVEGTFGGKYEYIPKGSRKAYAINKDGSRGQIVDSW